MVFHRNEDVGVTLETVPYVFTMSINMLSLHTIPRLHIITVDATCAVVVKLIHRVEQIPA